MRRIRFRAWDTKANKMLDDCGPWSFGVDGEMGDGWGGKCVNSDDLILLELTPFKDKNGKDIYEDDIVFHSHYKMRGVMEFYEARAQWGLRSIRKDKSVFIEIFPIDASFFEVLGNKHEHPALLQEYMVTIVFEAEVHITEKDYKKFKEQGHKMVVPDTAFAQVFGKDIKFTKAYVQFKEKNQL